MSYKYTKPMVQGLIFLYFALILVAPGTTFSPHDESKDLPTTTKQLLPVNTNDIPILKTFDDFQEMGKLPNQTAIENAVREYLENNPSVLGGLTISDLRFKETREYQLPYKRMYYVEYVQQKNGFDVEFSQVVVSASRLSSGQTTIYVSAKVYPGVNEILSPAQPMSAMEVLDDAAQAIGLDVKKTLIYHEQRIYTPGENDILQLKILITFDDDPRWTVVVGSEGVEGVRSNVFYAKPPVLSPPGVSGAIQGRGYRFLTSSQQPLDVLPMPNTDVALNIIASITDRMGVFNFFNQPAGNVSGRLRGPYADIMNVQGANLSFNMFVPQNSPTAITVNPTGNNVFDIAQVNAFHHTNIVHDWVKDRTNFTGIDLRLPVHVNDNTTFPCGAQYLFAPNPSMIFGNPGSFQSISCNNPAYDTIIYHEYGHFVDERAGGIAINNMEAVALSEGWGDVLATYVSGQSIEGQADLFSRNADNQYLYPSNALDMSHTLGTALSGFGWDLRRNIITRYSSPSVAEQLILAPLIGNAGSISDAVFGVILADDNDNNLNNGTPNLNEIILAANKHHLYPLIKLSSAVINTPIRHALYFNSTTPQVTIQGTANHSAFTSYQLSYGIGKNPSNWINIGPSTTTPVNNGTLGTWVLPSVPGTYMLRVVVNTSIPIIQYQYLVPVHINIPWIVFDVDLGWERSPHSDGQSVVWRTNNGIKLLNSAGLSILSASPLMKVKVNGSLIVWREHYYIYIYNAATPIQSRVLYPVNVGSYEMSDPDISGSKVYWSEYDYSNIGYSNIYVHDYATNQTTGLPLPAISGNRKDLSVSGSSLVYEVSYGNTLDSDIYHYNLTTGVETRITTDPARQINPSVSGNIIMYEDMRHGNFEIYAYDMSTATERRISNTFWQSRDPVSQGNVIVWTEMDAVFEWSIGAGEIWYYNLATNQTVQLTSSFEAKNIHPSITDIPGTSSKLILWESTIGGGSSPWQETMNIMGTLVQ